MAQEQEGTPQRCPGDKADQMHLLNIVDFPFKLETQMVFT